MDILIVTAAALPQDEYDRPYALACIASVAARTGVEAWALVDRSDGGTGDRWISGDTDVRRVLQGEVQHPTERGITGRVEAVQGMLESQYRPGAVRSVTVVDPELDLEPIRAAARRALHGIAERVTLIAPAPAGLSHAELWQLCSSMRVAMPLDVAVSDPF